METELELERGPAEESACGSWLTWRWKRRAARAAVCRRRAGKASAVVPSQPER